MQLCRELFCETSNLIGTDFEDASALSVKRHFVQGDGGGGVHVQFSVSYHAIGKTGKAAHDALEVLLPAED